MWNSTFYFLRKITVNEKIVKNIYKYVARFHNLSKVYKCVEYLSVSIIDKLWNFPIF